MFDDLTGQNSVKRKLAGLVDSNFGCAHIFCGESGLGKRTFAREYAMALLCVGGAYVPCGSCESCALFSCGALVDYLYIEPKASGQKPVISVDDIRKVTDWLYERPMYSERKVYVVAQADCMTEQAQNAFLKTLEEPPDYAAAILTVENIGALLPTVRSRCVVTWFARYSDGDIVKILNDAGHNLRDDLLRKLCDGRPGKALEIAANLEEYEVFRGEVVGLLSSHLSGDAQASYLLAVYLEKNRTHFTTVADIMILWLREQWIEAPFHAANGYLEQIERVERCCRAVASNANFSLAVNAMLVY